MELRQVELVRVWYRIRFRQRSATFILSPRKMGQCVGKSSSKRRELSLEPEELPQTRRDGFGIAERYARPASPPLDQVSPAGRVTPPVDYGREEVRLKELFVALRTGLVFTATEFSVLPGITTTAKVRFSVGSSKLQRLQEQANAKENALESDEHEVTERSVEANPQNNGDFELRVTLYGSAWAQGLNLQLTIWPVVGLFATRKLVFIWCENILRVQGCERGELNARALPVSFETESEFCKCCLLLAYHNDPTGNLHLEEMPDDTDEDSVIESENRVLPLSKLAYKVAVCNLNAIPKSVTIPAKIYHLLYGTRPGVRITIRMWPSTYAFGTAPAEMKVKSGLVFSEFVFLVREHFQIPPNATLKFYHNYKRVQLNEQVTSKFNTIDCFVISYRDSVCGSYSSGMDEVESDSTLVVSLVGYDVQNVQASTEMKLEDFDILLRRTFKLKNDSFLVILAEDDSTPQYTSCDNWKCIYPFSLPDNSISAGLRRSIRRLSSRRRRRPNIPSQRVRQLPGDLESSVFSPQAEKVVELLSTSNRHFPCNSDQFGPSMEELYQSMPMYRMSLEQCGIHQYAIIQAFEVTGPSIPITLRILSDHSQNPGSSQAKPQEFARTRLANIMDINPNWSIHTFLQYVDAIISPASVVRKKRLTLKDHSIEDSEDLSKLTLGELLDSWKPTWWPLKNAKRKQLTLRDIDPAEFLQIDKY